MSTARWYRVVAALYLLPTGLYLVRGAWVSAGVFVVIAVAWVVLARIESAVAVRRAALDERFRSDVARMEAALYVDREYLWRAVVEAEDRQRRQNGGPSL